MRHWIMILSAFLSINLGAQNVKKVYVKVIDTSGIGGSVADTNYIVGQLDIIRGELADTATLLRSDIADSLAITEALLRSDISDSLAITEALLRSDIADSLAITEALLRSDISDSLANMVTDNIYIADGTLTGNREISSSGYDLSFTGGGKVGIGTTSPSVKLHVFESSTANSQFTIENSNATNGKAIIGLKTGGSSNGDMRLQFSKTGTGTWYQGMDATDNNYSFAWNNSDLTTNSRLAITTTGNVGIGTSSPTNTLHVNSDGVNTTANFQSTDANANIGFTDNTTTALTGIGANGDQLRLYAGGNARAYISNSGNVGIGTSSPSVELDVIGDIEYTGTITDVSDERLKENFAPIDSALQKVIAINPTLFTMKGSDRVESGYKAQNVQEHFSHVVKEVDEAGTLGLDYTQMISLLHQAIKDQQVLIDNLETRIEELENQ